MPPLVIKTTGFEDFLDPSGGAYVKALIMGDHGVGKTPSAANWPKPILADCENGRMSVASMGIPYVDIKNSSDMAALLDMLRRECMKPADKRQYQTLVVDTVDTYQRKLIQERLKSERKENLSGWADWGWLDGKMIALVEGMLNLPMNVVVNMHTKDVSEDDGEESRLVQKARLKGDIKDSIFQDFDLIGHMEQSYEANPAKKGERLRVRQIRWHSEPKYPSLRDRSNKLPRFTEVTFTGEDYWQIFNAITSGLDDLPKSRDIETLEVEGDDATAPPPADLNGGPLTEPVVPAAKKTTAKAAAKKAPAKKAPATPEAATDVPEPDQWAPPATDLQGAGGDGTATPVATPVADLDDSKADMPTATDVDTTAEKLVEDQLGGVAVDEEAATPVAEATPSAAPPVAPPVAPKHCGDQPASMVGKHDPVPGCGKVLTKDNAGKAQIAVVKYRTYLCDEDFAARQVPSS